MEVLMNPFKTSGAMKMSSWRRRKYGRVDGANKKSMKVVRFGGSKRSWRIKAVPRLRWKMLSPVRLWSKFKNAYVKMMYSIGGNVRFLNGGGANEFGQKRIVTSKGGGAGQQKPAKMGYTKTEFETRLMFEIYKSLAPSMELYPIS